MKNNCTSTVENGLAAAGTGWKLLALLLCELTILQPGLRRRADVAGSDVHRHVGPAERHADVRRFRVDAAAYLKAPPYYASPTWTRRYSGGLPCSR